MKRRIRLLVTVTAVTALLTACGGAGGPADPTEPTEEPSDDGADGTDPDDTTEPDQDTGESDGALGAEVDAAVADASAHFDVDADDIEVVTAEAVTWPDGSIGCPQPDEMYTQALVDGYRILLSVDGSEVAYHGREGEDPQRCDDPTDPVG